MKASFDPSVKKSDLQIIVEGKKNAESLLIALVNYVREYNDPTASKLLEVVIEYLDHLESEISI